MKTLYFTGTGNCLHVARQIGGELLSIPQLMKKEVIEIEDDAVGIVCPIYAGNMPKIVHHFLEKAKIKTDYFFLVYTYGMDATVATPNGVKAASRAGLSLDYVAEIKMVDNYLPGFKMEEQIRTAPDKGIERQIEQACQDIAARKRMNYHITVAQRASMALIHETMEIHVLADDAAQQYTVNDACVQCGICTKVCPVGNIRQTEDGHIRFGNYCEVCYACIQNCPQHAIHLPNEQSGVRFRNENVNLQEIIEANCQQ